MQITFRCPRCEQTSRVDVPQDGTGFSCPRCSGAIEVPADAIGEDVIKNCLLCRSPDLFIRKDFPQRLGVAIVTVGFIASTVAWYYYRPLLAFGILFAIAGIDVLLYLFMGEALVCYRCGAHYRKVANAEDHGAFDLETHERYRQIAARQADQNAGSSNVAS